MANWPLKELHANFPMAVLGGGSLVASAFRRPARILLFAPETGAIMASSETCGDADDVFEDATRHRLYVSCGEGAVDVPAEQGAALTRLARVPTPSGARTALYVPEVDRLYVAARAGLIGSDASILVLKPQP